MSDPFTFNSAEEQEQIGKDLSTLPGEVYQAEINYLEAKRKYEYFYFTTLLTAEKSNAKEKEAVAKVACLKEHLLMNDEILTYGEWKDTMEAMYNYRKASLDAVKKRANLLEARIRMKI